MRGTAGFRDRLAGHTQGTRISYIFTKFMKSRVPMRENLKIGTQAHFHRLKNFACAPSAAPNFTAFSEFHRLTCRTSIIRVISLN